MDFRKSLLVLLEEKINPIVSEVSIANSEIK
jgi:hypothetical protein